MLKYTLLAAMAALIVACGGGNKENTVKADAVAPAAASKSNKLHDEVTIAASPARVYDALLDQQQFSERSGGMPTSIDRTPGGAFSCFGGHIVGRQVELVPDHLIVQAWRTVDWPEGVYSIARFELDSVATGTHIVFDHIGFPEGWQAHLDSGWYQHYWEPLKKTLEARH